MTINEFIYLIVSLYSGIQFWVLDFFNKLINLDLLEITILQAIVIPAICYFILNYVYGFVRSLFTDIKAKLSTSKKELNPTKNPISTDISDKLLFKLNNSKNTPSYRKAYSDRTAWLMACLSDLAYRSFGSIDPEWTKQFLQERLNDFLDSSSKDNLGELIRSVHKADIQKKNMLTSELDNSGITVESTYDHKDTQAFLASTDQYLILVFRGTEATSFTDIKTDLKATQTKCSTAGKVHSGFNAAFEFVKDGIQNDLDKNKFAKKPLFIAGHSLGGALATIAAKRLNHKGGMAACYTFGSPRVGNEDWTINIKTPIYRVVNAIDCVTMVPPGGEVIYIGKLLLGLIPNPFVAKILKNLLKPFEGYSHAGDMRYLTNCKTNKYDDVEVTNHQSFLRRMRVFFRGKRPNRFVNDHSISIYRKKLAIIALRNNPQT
jgi:hypothetical protein